jgi:hypothetical protein
MPMANTKLKIFKEKFKSNFQKKISPETVERTLKSWKRFWNIFGGRVRKPKNACGVHKNENLKQNCQNFKKYFYLKMLKKNRKLKKKLSKKLLQQTDTHTDTNTHTHTHTHRQTDPKL